MKKFESYKMVNVIVGKIMLSYNLLITRYHNVKLVVTKNQGFHYF